MEAARMEAVRLLEAAKAEAERVEAERVERAERAERAEAAARAAVRAAAERAAVEAAVVCLQVASRCRRMRVREAALRRAVSIVVRRRHGAVVRRLFLLLRTTAVLLLASRRWRAASSIYSVHRPNASPASLRLGTPAALLLLFVLRHRSTAITARLYGHMGAARLFTYERPTLARHPTMRQLQSSASHSAVLLVQRRRRAVNCIRRNRAVMVATASLPASCPSEATCAQTPESHVRMTPATVPATLPAGTGATPPSLPVPQVGLTPVLSLMTPVRRRWAPTPLATTTLATPTPISHSPTAPQHQGAEVTTAPKPPVVDPTAAITTPASARALRVQQLAQAVMTARRTPANGGRRAPASAAAAACGFRGGISPSQGGGEGQHADVLDSAELLDSTGSTEGPKDRAVVAT